MPPVHATRPTLAALRQRLADLREEREGILMAYDFALTRGKTRQVDDEIVEVLREIGERCPQAA